MGPLLSERRELGKWSDWIFSRAPDPEPSSDWRTASKRDDMVEREGSIETANKGNALSEATEWSVWLVMISRGALFS